jgi:hypothetical protein
LLLSKLRKKGSDKKKPQQKLNVSNKKKRLQKKLKLKELLLKRLK